jgi:uncharacterized protein YecE (DUF72 family)
MPNGLPPEKGTLLVGCCGFRGARAKYFRAFPAVEVQQTFYHPPQANTLKRWRWEAPADFVFTVKAWQLITHEVSSPTYRRLRLKLDERQKKGCGSFRSSEEVDRGWQATLEACRILESPVVLFQTPARFVPSPMHLRNLRQFFERIERAGLRLVFEPRGGDWTTELVSGLCEELDLVHGVDPFVALSARAPILYFRIHGIGGYRHRFTALELDGLLRRLPTSAQGYIFFNNISMCDDAASLAKKLATRR